jgi:hypothetical protein
MIGAGVLMLASALFWPPIKSNEAAQLAVIAGHPARYYLSTVLILGGSMLLVPALIYLMAMAQDRSPKLAHIGGSLSVVGALVAVGDPASQLVVWQMAARGADRAQMAAALNRFENTAGSSLIFTIGGFGIVVGVVLLAVALYRARAVPVWSAAGLVAGTWLNVIGFSAGSTGVLIISSALLLGSLGWIGWQVLTGSADQRRVPSFEPATGEA